MITGMINRSLSRVMGISGETEHRGSSWQQWATLTGAGNNAFGRTSDSGEVVNAGRILETSTVWRAVQLISGDVSTIPQILYRRTDAGKERATDHYGYRLMRWKTGALTANIWKMRAIAQALLYGNSFSVIEGIGRKKQLILLHPDHVKMEENKAADGGLMYVVGDGTSNRKEYYGHQIFHLQGLTLDVFGGKSIIHYARNTIGRHLSAEKYGADFFKSGAPASGWFTTPHILSEEAQRALLTSYNESVKNGNRHRVGILTDGMGWEPTGVTPSDAQMIDMLKLSPYDVARYFGLPPHKLGIPGLQTATNAAEENDDYYSSTIVQWCSKLDFEAWDKLLLETEKNEQAGGMFYEHQLSSLLRAKTIDRYSVYQKAIANRILNPNECRALENLNPYEGGDEYVNPYTTANSDTTGQGKNGSDTEGLAESGVDDGNEIPRKRSLTINNAAIGIVRDSVMRVAKRLEIAGESLSKHPERFASAISSIQDKHGVTVRDWLRPSLGLLVAHTGEPMDSLLEATAEAVFTAFQDEYLRASETRREDFASSIRAASERFRITCGQLISDLTKGIEHGN